jgi:hypothetical protein
MENRTHREYTDADLPEFIRGESNRPNKNLINSRRGFREYTDADLPEFRDDQVIDFSSSSVVEVSKPLGILEMGLVEWVKMKWHNRRAKILNSHPPTPKT